MLLKFELNDYNQLICTNTEELSKTDDISYIQVLIQVKSKSFSINDAMIAVFKSASYNIMERVLLSWTETKKLAGFIPSKVFDHGGVIQMLIYRNSIDGPDAQVSTNTYEFYIDPKRYVPLTTPAIWEAIVNDIIDIRSILEAGVDYEDIDNKPAIEGVILIGDQTYEELNLSGLTNLEIDAMCI